MHSAEPGPLRNGTHPPVGGAPLESLPIAASKDGAFVAFADGEVDGPRGARDERNDGGLVALAEYPEGAVSSLEAEILDVRGACLANPETVEPEQHHERGVVTIEAFRGEQERAQFGAVHSVAIGGVHSGSPDVLGWVRGGVAIDVSEAVEAAHRRKPSVDRRCCQSSALEDRAVQLDVRSSRVEHGKSMVFGPLKEHLKVVAVGVECSAAVPGQERGDG